MMRSIPNPGSGSKALRSVLFAGALAAAGVWVVAADPASKPTTRPAVASTQRAATQATTTAAASTRPADADVPPPPLTPAEQKQVDAALAALSADSWKDRQAAQDALVPFGQSVVARLRALAEKSADEEVRTRASAALRQIEDNATLGGSVITLHLKNAPAKDAFAEIARQARCEFPTYPRNLWQQNNGMFNGGAGGATVTVDFDRAGFWTVFKEVCKQTGVFPQQYGNDRRMTLGQGQSNYWNGPTFVSGPFMIVANRLDRSNSVDLSNPNNVTRSFAMGLSAFAEPKVKVLSSSYNVQVDSAVDDKGNSLLATDAQGFNGMSNGQQWMWNLSARLNYPENPGKQIKSIKGNVKFLVQTKSETLDIPEVLTAKNVTKTVANCRLLLKEVKKNGEQYDVQMTIYRDGMSQQEWNALQYPGYAVRLLDKDGRQLSAQGWGGGGSATELNYNWNFGRNNWGGEEGKIGDPYRLVWEIPLETRESVVNFEFKDLPLP